jgi:hypothetical protein
MLAKLRLRIQHKPEEKASACVDYFISAYEAPTCFMDIRPSLRELDTQHLEDLSQEIEKFINKLKSENTTKDGVSSQIVQRTRSAIIHHLRLEFAIKVSQSCQPPAAGLGGTSVYHQGSTPEEIEDFVRNCLVFAKEELVQHKDQKGEVAFLVAVSLIHLAFHPRWEGKPRQSYLIGAAMAFEWIASVVDQRHSTLLYVRLLLYLGLGSNAWRHYSTLRIKSVVTNSLAYHMFSRISVQQPLCEMVEVSGKVAHGDDKLVKRLGQNVQFYTREINSWAMDSYNLGFREDMPHADAIFEVAEFEERLDQSFVRVLLRLENRRIHRMSGTKFDDFDPRECDLVNKLLQT